MPGGEWFVYPESGSLADASEVYKYEGGTTYPWNIEPDLFASHTIMYPLYNGASLLSISDSTVNYPNHICE